jgi:hypothetical protein
MQKQGSRSAASGSGRFNLKYWMQMRGKCNGKVAPNFVLHNALNLRNLGGGAAFCGPGR